MNYQKILEKIIQMETKSFEKMRLTFVLVAALVFGIVLQQVVFASENSATAKTGIQPKKQIASVSSIARAEDVKKEDDAKTVNIEMKNDILENSENSGELESVTGKEARDVLGVESTQVSNKSNSVGELSNALVFNSNPDFLPIRNYNISDIDIAAKAAIALSEDGKLLYEKNIHDKLPIASLTKVMTAVVVLEELDPEEMITVTRDVIEETEGIAGRFRPGEKVAAGDLLKIMLVISSNDAAAAFEDHFKSKKMDMIALMNKKAEELGLKNTHFSNPVGFDDEENYSTAYDYATFITKVLDNEKLWSILSIKNQLIRSTDPEFPDRRIISSDKLAFRNIDDLLGGKTGYTENANGCLMVGFKVSGENGRGDERVVSVVLGASGTQARFDESEKLIRWVREAYIF